MLQILDVNGKIITQQPYQHRKELITIIIVIDIHYVTT